MVDLTDKEKKVLETLRDLGATTEDKLRTADDVMKKSRLPKTLVSNSLVSLTNKKVVKRVVRQKAAGYYLLQA